MWGREGPREGPCLATGFLQGSCPVSLVLEAISPEQTALLASPVYIGQAQREEKKHIKRGAKIGLGASLLFASFGSAQREKVRSQPGYQDTLDWLSWRVSLFIGTCQPLYQQLSGARAAPISSLISNCQPHYQHLFDAREAEA